MKKIGLFPAIFLVGCASTQDIGRCPFDVCSGGFCQSASDIQRVESNLLIYLRCSDGKPVITNSWTIRERE